MFEYDVFLSFASNDIERARPVWQRLAASGLRVFWSDETLRSSAGRNYVSAIQQAIIGSKHFVLFWSPNAGSSAWVEEEYQVFYGLCYMRDKKTRRLVVLHETPSKPYPLPPFLAQLQAADSIGALVGLLGGTDIDAPKSRNSELEHKVRNLETEVQRLRSEKPALDAFSLVPAVEASAPQNTDGVPESKLRFQISDRNGSSYILRDLHIKYPSGFGPESEKQGIKVRHGALEAFIKWSEIKAVEFVNTKRIAIGEIKYNYTVNITSRDGTMQTVEIVPDWNMKAGATGLLFGVTSLGGISIQFTDLYRIERVPSKTQKTG